MGVDDAAPSFGNSAFTTSIAYRGRKMPASGLSTPRSTGATFCANTTALA